MSKVGDQLEAKNAAWSFGGNVPKNFQQHAKRSIPFYEEGHRLIAYISDFFLNNETVCYDLGTSTGELIQILCDRHTGKNIQYIGIDQEEKMINEAFKRFKDNSQVQFQISDITQIKWQPADLIISYYTIQFCPLSKRKELMQSIYNNLKPGGAFLFFEKILSEDSQLENIAQAVYTDYKLDEGYSSNDIINKTRSLKGILSPLESNENQQLLQSVGFDKSTQVFKWVCFEGILAIKK